jgi:hypothetical protein
MDDLLPGDVGETLGRLMNDFQELEAAADSGRCRSGFRSDGDQRSEVMPITIPS